MLDDFISTVGHSPFHCVLLEPVGTSYRIVMASADMRADHTGDQDLLDAVPDATALIHQIHDLMAAGFTDGMVDCGRGAWADGVNSDDGRAYWETCFTPIRDGGGSQYIHLSLAPMTSEDFALHTKKNGTRLTIERPEL